LIAADHPLDWVQAQLAALDPEQACLREIKELGQKSLQDSAADHSAISSRTPLIRVSSERVDDLMAEIGDMRSALSAFADLLQNGRMARSINARSGHDAPSAAAHLDGRDISEAINADLRNFRELHHTLERAHRRIWEIGLQIRVVPVDALFSRLARAARDLAEKLGKEVDVTVEGREVRIDKSMVDLLVDPLMHMIRNAVDHGIETPAARQSHGKPRRASITIAASESGNNVEVVISDDGQGLDHAKIAAKAVALGMVSADVASQMTASEINAFIFRPGFSTAGSVSEISGRGVGLDVVETSLQRLGGTIEVKSSFGAGTQFLLKLPVSAALLRTLLVEVEERIFALPERQVIVVQESAEEKIQSSGGQDFFIHRGAAVPVRDLGRVLGFGAKEAGVRKTSHLVLVSTGSRLFGLGVNRVLHFQDLFLKELHPMLASIPIVAGAAVLGDGRPVLVLDVGALASFESSEPATLQ
jgi:two-component system, chemotaxis family, sensor kinase CheA